MRGVVWLGPVVLVAGLLLGGLLAGGMFAAETNRRAQQTPEALVPVGVPAAVPLPAGAGDATRGTRRGGMASMCVCARPATGRPGATPVRRCMAR